jgi:hypothetical protein
MKIALWIFRDKRMDKLFVSAHTDRGPEFTKSPGGISNVEMRIVIDTDPVCIESVERLGPGSVSPEKSEAQPMVSPAIEPKDSAKPRTPDLLVPLSITLWALVDALHLISDLSEGALDHKVEKIIERCKNTLDLLRTIQ